MSVEFAVVEPSLQPLDVVAVVVDRTADRALAGGVFEHDQREDGSRVLGAIDLVGVEGRLAGERLQLFELVAGDEHVEPVLLVEDRHVARVEFEHRHARLAVARGGGLHVLDDRPPVARHVLVRLVLGHRRRVGDASKSLAFGCGKSI